MSGTLHPLLPEQAHAADPHHSVWLSASAGTGKTQVLSARVLRLLLQPGVTPDSILCLTFTKAGAAEMATRVNERLAKWVRMDETLLAAELRAIGAKVDRDSLARARTLFTRVLDCPGGGLRIDTIHAFAQYLLAAFPEEAGLEPGTVAMDDRTRELLVREVLTELVAHADEDDRSALSMLSLKLGPDGAKAWLMACAKARELWAEPGGWRSPMRARVLELLGLPTDFDEAALARECADGAFDTGSLDACLAILREWDTKGGREGVDTIGAWLGGDPAHRLATIGSFNGTLLVADGSKAKNLHHLVKRDPAYEGHIEAVRANLDAIREKQALLALAEYLAPALELGRRFAHLWDEAKRTRGLVDFDDQIARAAALLANSDMAQWIGYKLDRSFDHILVDEAQDTNASQWAIIDALTQDYFDGLGAAGARLRTVFVVGDYKQAIFGFQGTEPQLFLSQREKYREKIDQAIANADELARDTRDAPLVQLSPLQPVELRQNFRSSQTILDFVDRALAHVGTEAMGMAGESVRHTGEDRPGRVTLWHPIRADEGDDPEAVEEDGAETWLPAPERRMADRIAAQVKAWLDANDPDGGHPLTKGGARRASAGDIMILVRKRRALAGLIVARLHAAGVPVAGVDRLRLGAPLAVKDLLAALRFAAQPRDSLSLANLLVSPLGGWSQDDLLRHGLRERDVTLWDHIRRSDAQLCMATAESLRGLLAKVDYEPPAALLHWLLSGPWDGRRKLVSRLGREANDPIDELVGAAFAYAAEHTPSLQGFLNWFDASDEELKREAAASGDAVRVLTAHGSKGLQAPIVILADATGNPDRGPARAGELETTDGRTVPLPSLPKDARAGPVAAAEEAKAAREREEHWRLMYVAMTRAEEALYIGGALLPSDKDVPEASWYAQAQALFDQEPLPDPIWGARHDIGTLADQRMPASEGDKARDRAELPAWVTHPPAAEPVPTRPLAPSSVGDDLAPNPPGLARGGEASLRGTLIHRLLERLPDIAPQDRATRAARWLEAQAREIDEDVRGEMIAQALGVLENPEFVALFAPGALAEVSLAATVDGQVVTGKLDRLCVGEDAVLVVDYKTTRRPPQSLDQVPVATLRQMSAYSHALAAIYPGRRISAALLYTHAPQLIALPEALLARHKPGFGDKQQSLAAPDFA